jgi:hypothetical protein
MKQTVQNNLNMQSVHMVSLIYSMVKPQCSLHYTWKENSDQLQKT